MILAPLDSVEGVEETSVLDPMLLLAYSAEPLACVVEFDVLVGVVLTMAGVAVVIES